MNQIYAEERRAARKKLFVQSVLELRKCDRERLFYGTCTSANEAPLVCA